MGDFQFNKRISVKSELDSFLEDLAMKIQDADIGLDEYCTNGGSIDETSVSNLKLTGSQSSGTVEGTFYISFNETYYNGCRDLEWNVHYAGTMTFELNPETGELEITHEDIQQVLSDAERADLEELQKENK